MKLATERQSSETVGLHDLQTIAIVNQKGGVGKTSLAMNLAWFLDTANGRTMVLDADPQRSASRWAESQNGSWTVEVRGLDAERDITVVSQDIERLASEAGAEFVVLDCPPELRNAAEVALLLADVSLIPVTPSPLDIWAAEAAVALATDAQRIRGDGRPRVALVPNRLIRSTLMARELPSVLEALGKKVAPGITERIVIAESAIAGQTVPEYSPNNPACGEFLELARFVMELLK
jgi:chromosome partitioning protein